MERLGAARGVGRIVNQAGMAIALNDLVDERRSQSHSLGILAEAVADTALQYPPQVFGGTGVAAKISKRPALEQPDLDLALIHLCRPMQPVIGYGRRMVSSQFQWDERLGDGRRRGTRG